MPKPKRPRSKPDLVDRLCAAIEQGRARGAVSVLRHAMDMLVTVARHLGVGDEEAQEAVALALARRLILIDGTELPHSVALDRGLRD